MNIEKELLHKNIKKQNTEVVITGQGESIELCFTETAKSLFAVYTDISQIQIHQIINFEFVEDNIEKALKLWLKLLLEKAREHQLMFGDFRLTREGKVWKAIVSGQRRDHKVSFNFVVLSIMSLSKINNSWESRCIIGLIS